MTIARCQASICQVATAPERHCLAAGVKGLDTKLPPCNLADKACNLADQVQATGKHLLTLFAFDKSANLDLKKVI